jgi:hypothetical protein
MSRIDSDAKRMLASGVRSSSKSSQCYAWLGRETIKRGLERTVNRHECLILGVHDAGLLVASRSHDLARGAFRSQQPLHAATTGVTNSSKVDP